MVELSFFIVYDAYDVPECFRRNAGADRIARGGDDDHAGGGIDAALEMAHVHDTEGIKAHRLHVQPVHRSMEMVEDVAEAWYCNAVALFKYPPEQVVADAADARAQENINRRGAPMADEKFPDGFAQLRPAGRRRIAKVVRMRLYL